jgi:7-cyano-7-deazaguanine synthase
MSGGIDSSACALFYARLGFAVHGVHITYAQPAASREKLAAETVASEIGIPISLLKMDGAIRLPDTEIPGRNAFLIIAAFLALQAPAGLMALGIHAGTPYFDCSPTFALRMQALLDGYAEGRTRLASPFITWTKLEVWEFALSAGLPTDLTYSCELGLPQPCGKCRSCKDLEELIVRTNKHPRA